MKRTVLNLLCSTWTAVAAITALALMVTPDCRAQAGSAPAGSPIQEDLRSVRSPDGKLEIQVFVGQPLATETALLPRMAYRVLYQGKPVVETSFLGFELRAQNPMGEKPGLTNAEKGSGEGFNSVLCHYLQNGSQGRLFDIEARAYNSGVAFRYHIPWSAPMEYVLLEGENTEFQFPAGARAAAGVIADLPIDREFPLPFAVDEPGVAAVSISQSGGETYAPVTLRHDVSSLQGPTMVTVLGRLKDKPWLAVDTKPPFATPWRVISVASEPGQLNPPLR